MGRAGWAEEEGEAVAYSISDSSGVFSRRLWRKEGRNWIEWSERRV